MFNESLALILQTQWFLTRLIPFYFLYIPIDTVVHWIYTCKRIWCICILKTQIYFDIYCILHNLHSSKASPSPMGFYWEPNFSENWGDSPNGSPGLNNGEVRQATHRNNICRKHDVTFQRTSSIRSYWAKLYSLSTFVLLGLYVCTLVALAGTGQL